MELHRPKLGDRYRVYIDNQNRLSNTPTNATIPAQVIAVDDYDTFRPFALGWKDTEVHPASSHDRSHPYTWQASKARYIDHLEEYTHIEWPLVDDEHLFHVVGAASKSPVISGHACRSCHNYSPYAAANQSDGSFLCFSCRKYPFYQSPCHEEI